MVDSFLDKLIRKLRTRKVLKFIPQNNGAICDVGCGTEPKFLLDLEEKILEGWGIDKKTVTKNWTDKIKTIEHDLDVIPFLPFPENKFDCVLMVAILEHFKSPRRVLREAWRILKQNGILILTTPTKISKPVLEFLAFRLNLVSKEEIEDHKHYYSKGELFNLLKDPRFYIVKHCYFELGFNQLVLAKKQK